MPQDAIPWSAIVLTGGTGRRLGGADKAGLVLGDRSALDRLLGAIPASVPVVVAGPETSTNRPVEFRAEEPAGGGPVAGITAALPLIGTPTTVIVAVDMPWSGALLPHLVDELARGTADVVVPVDRDGRAQYLCSAWRTDRLGEALDSLRQVRDAAMRAVLRAARMHEWLVPDELVGDLLDIDDEADLTAARRRAQTSTLTGIDE